MLATLRKDVKEHIRQPLYEILLLARFKPSKHCYAIVLDSPIRGIMPLA